MSILVITTSTGIDLVRKSKYSLYYLIAASILNFVLNLLFVPIFGSSGAAIATGLSYVFYFWIKTIKSRKLWFDFDCSHFIKMTILLMIAALVNSIPSLAQSFVYLIDAIIIFLGLNLYKGVIIDFCFLIKEEIRRERKEKC